MKEKHGGHHLHHEMSEAVHLGGELMAGSIGLMALGAAVNSIKK